MAKKAILVPLDPVHDIALKMIARQLEEAGHDVILLQPDLSTEEIIATINSAGHADALLVSRTLGYGVGELLASFVDILDAAGLRDRMRVAIGGMAVRPELAAELGFDAGFGPGTDLKEVVAFVEDSVYDPLHKRCHKTKRDMTAGYDYTYLHSCIQEKLEIITDRILAWAEDKSSPGIERAAIRDKYWNVYSWRAREVQSEFNDKYPEFCEEIPANFFKHGTLHPKTRRLSVDEVKKLEKYVEHVKANMLITALQHTRKKPLIFNQYGTGCPLMDIGHVAASEAWGADGVVHFDPSWGARTEGFIDGFLTHQEDGTVITPANLNRIKLGMQDSTLWQIRAHRGLNTPETVVLAGKLGADLTKINICYGALGAGTDPARLTLDACQAIRYAKQYNLPFDVVTNEELAGVPAYKAFAGMLITAALGVKLGARPILQPLFAYSPEAMINNYMQDNYIDFNAAKIQALRSIIRAPIWAGAPIGFLTQTEDRVQSAMTTALHAALATSLELDGISIASTDEAYSGGPITVPAKIDTLRAVGEACRFLGQASIQPTDMADIYAAKIVEGIDRTLQDVLDKGDFVEAIHAGCLGTRREGAYPGRAGKGTVSNKGGGA